MNTDRKKYIIVLLITLGIFIVVFGLVSLLNSQKIANIDDLQRKITADLIATETQFDLLKTAPCSSVKNTIISQELGELGKKLDFAQTNQGSDDSDVVQLKKYYSLLQVKDYLLMKEFSGKCDIDIDSLLYFYNSDCEECIKQGYVLTEFKKRYPELRIYSFDADLDFSVIDTFIGLYNFGDVYPTLIVGDDVYQNFQGLDELRGIFPELVKQKEKEDVQKQGIVFIKKELGYDNIWSKEILDETYSYTYVIDVGKEEEIFIDVILSLDDEGGFEIISEISEK